MVEPGHEGYGGARSCKDLKTIILDSAAIRCPMVLNPNAEAAVS